MDPLATVPELEARWRVLTPDEKTRAETLLDDASALVRGASWDNGKGFRLDSRMVPVPPATEPVLDPKVVVIIVCAMVKRAMVDVGAEIGEGVTSLQNTAGPFSRSVSFANPNGDVYLTKRESRQLGISVQKAYTVDTLPAHAGRYPGYDREVDRVVDILNGVSGQLP